MLPTADPIGGQRKDGDRLFSEVQGQAAVVKSFNIGDSNEIFFFFSPLENIRILEELPKKLCDLQPCRYSKRKWTQP